MAELAGRPRDPLGVAVRRRPPRPRTRPCPRRRTSPTAPPRPRPRRRPSTRPSGSTRRAQSPALRRAGRRRRPGRRARAARGRPRRPARRATARGSPSRTTVARGATSAASPSSFCFARSSCQIPIPVFATMIARKSASRQSPKTRVSSPSASRIALNGVTMLARTMLAVERLAGGSLRPPRAARRCRSLGLGQARGHRREANSGSARDARTQGWIDLAVRLCARRDLPLALDRLGRDREQLAEPAQPDPLRALVEQLLLEVGRELEAAGERERQLGRLCGRRLDVGRRSARPVARRARAPARRRPARRGRAGRRPARRGR